MPYVLIAPRGRPQTLIAGLQNGDLLLTDDAEKTWRILHTGLGSILALGERPIAIIGEDLCDRTLNPGRTSPPSRVSLAPSVTGFISDRKTTTVRVAGLMSQTSGVPA